MTEQTRLHRPKQSNTASTQSSHSAPQGTQLFVDNSSRVNAQSELLDTLTAPSTDVLQRVEEKENEQKPEYLDLSDKPWFPEGPIRGDQIEVPDGAPEVSNYRFNMDNKLDLSYKPNRKKLKQAKFITDIFGHSTKRWGSISSVLSAFFGGLNNADKNK